MVEDFILEFAKLISDYPEEIEIDRKDIDDSFSEILIIANKQDTGKLIGKNGKMITSLKTIISGCKAKENRSYRVVVKAHE